MCCLCLEVSIFGIARLLLILEFFHSTSKISGGSIEFMNECTTIDTPFCLYDADRNKDTNSFNGPGVLVCSIDNMPTQIPRESTDFFGDLLYPFTFDILQSNAKEPLENHNFSPAIHGVSIFLNYLAFSNIYLYLKL